MSKLRELGWGSELDRIASETYEPLRQHGPLRLAKPLTDRGEPPSSVKWGQPTSNHGQNMAEDSGRYRGMHGDDQRRPSPR